MNKSFYSKYINIIIKLTKNINTWYQNTKLHNNDIIRISELIILFIYKISYFIEISDYHYIITLIYYKRFILSQSEKDPFIIFVISFIYCLKYWEEQEFYIKCVYDYLKEFKLNMFELEFEIVQFDIPLNIHINTYQTYYEHIFI